MSATFANRGRTYTNDAGWRNLESRQAHNLETAGSSPVPAIAV